MPHLEVVFVLHGVDVSSYQTDFGTDGLDFVFVKATEGRTCVNPRPAGQVKRARDAGWVLSFSVARTREGGTPGEPRIEAVWRIHRYTDHPLGRNVAGFRSREAMWAWAGQA